MIDYFALALIHGLIAIAVIRLLGREGLDRDPQLAREDESPKRQGRRNRDA